MCRPENSACSPPRKSIGCARRPDRRWRPPNAKPLPEVMDRFFDLVIQPARTAGQSAKATVPSLADPSSSLIKLNANESVYGPSPKAVAAMRSALENSHLYPDNDSSALRGRLAEKHC